MNSRPAMPAIALLAALLFACGWGEHHSSRRVRSLAVSNTFRSGPDGPVQRTYTIEFRPPRGYFEQVRSATLVDAAGQTYEARRMSVGSSSNARGVTSISATFEIPESAEPVTVRFAGADLDISHRRLTRTGR